ncbi:MAG: ParB N-terminal domain-containing protein, partial [Chloroflexota bacterium]
MSNRRRDRQESNVFDSSGIVTSEMTDSAIFGGIADVDSGRQVAKPVSIFDIFPDPLQPRRAIPSPVRAYWDGRPSTTHTLFNAWFRMAVEERGADFKIEPFLVGLEEVPRPEKMGPIDAALIDLLEMAANIRSNGLTNPITVANTGTSYRLETGERRWLAYHILNTYFEDEQEKWSRIPARVVDGFSVWRQASENNARANLNAISKARQLAILLMDIYQRRSGEKFKSYEEIVGQGDCDRAFYAQVADGTVYPTPQGMGEAVMTAGGFKTSSMMREHRSLLDLPDEVWRVADDLNWTQGRIRQLMRQSEGDDKNLIS